MFVFKGQVVITDSIIVKVNERKYENKIVELAYIERSKHFLFVKYGKWKAKLFVKSECGKDQVKEINIVRK